MIEWVRKFLYRIFCVIALLVSVYLVVDFLYSGTFDYRVFVMFVLMVVVIIWGIVDWRKNYLIMQQKEQELRILGRCFSRLQKVFAVACCKRPVVMLS